MAKDKKHSIEEVIPGRKHKLDELIDFGERLIKTEDLDPCYVALHRAGLPRRQLERLLLAYFLFYHFGASARLSEAEDDNFWELMLEAAENKGPPTDLHRWPRAAERRHFRGARCVAAVKSFAEYPPEYFIQTLAVASRGQELATVMGWVQQKPMFGGWAAFKVADVLERVLSVPIIFPNDLTLLYSEPRAALDMLDIPAEEANVKLLRHFAKFKAPPKYDCFCKVNETETILCKTKSYWGGHYFLGKDIHEIRKGLVGWGETASKLLSVMPPEVERGLFR